MDRCEQRHDRPLHVLVVKLSSLGDIIHATGCLRAIRQALPQARLTMAVEHRWQDVISHNPNIDHWIGSSPRQRLTPSYLAEIRRSLASEAPYDIAIDFMGNRRSAAWIYLSRAKVKTGRGGFRPGWRKAIQPDLSRHAVDVCADICREAGILVADASPEIRTSPADEEHVRQILAAQGIAEEGYIVINPFSRWTSKSWPLENLASVIRSLKARTAQTLVLSGGPEDLIHEATLRKHLGACTLDSVVGRLSLGEALCFLRRARLMVSCDSGPMHAAAAFGVPTIGLFGPTHPERTGPWGNGHRVIQAKRPDSHHAYRNDPDAFYMGFLDKDAIVSAIMAELSQQPTCGSHC